MREYYDRRAPEYDDWYRGIGLFAARGRPFPDGETLLDGDWFVTVRAR